MGFVATRGSSGSREIFRGEAQTRPRLGETFYLLVQRIPASPIGGEWAGDRERLKLAVRSARVGIHNHG